MEDSGTSFLLYMSLTYPTSLPFSLSIIPFNFPPLHVPFPLM